MGEVPERLTLLDEEKKIYEETNAKLLEDPFYRQPYGRIAAHIDAHIVASMYMEHKIFGKLIE